MEEGGGGWGRRVGEGDWLCTWRVEVGEERERLLWSRIDGHQKSITDLNRIDGLLGWRAKGGGNEDAPRGGDEAGGGEGRAHGESIRNTGPLHLEMRDFEQRTGFPRFGWPGVIGHHA